MMEQTSLNEIQSFYGRILDPSHSNPHHNHHSLHLQQNGINKNTNKNNNNNSNYQFYEMKQSSIDDYHGNYHLNSNQNDPILHYHHHHQQQKQQQSKHQPYHRILSVPSQSSTRSITNENNSHNCLGPFVIPSSRQQNVFDERSFNRFSTVINQTNPAIRIERSQQSNLYEQYYPLNQQEISLTKPSKWIEYNLNQSETNFNDSNRIDIGNGNENNQKEYKNDERSEKEAEVNDVCSQNLREQLPSFLCHNSNGTKVIQSQSQSQFRSIQNLNCLSNSNSNNNNNNSMNQNNIEDNGISNQNLMKIPSNMTKLLRMNENGNEIQSNRHLQRSSTLEDYDQQHTMPLPNGWEKSIDPETGRCYFVNHFTRETQWFDPRDVLTKPSTFADCIGDELPIGWEQAYHPLLGHYFIDHINRSNQIEDPRIEWLAVQANMLIGYLKQATKTETNESETIVDPSCTIEPNKVFECEEKIYSNMDQIGLHQNSDLLSNQTNRITKKITFSEPLIQSKTDECVSSEQTRSEQEISHSTSTNIDDYHRIEPIDNFYNEPILFARSDPSDLHKCSSKVSLIYDENSDYAVIDGISSTEYRENDPNLSRNETNHSITYANLFHVISPDEAQTKLSPTTATPKSSSSVLLTSSSMSKFPSSLQSVSNDCTRNNLKGSNSIASLPASISASKTGHNLANGTENDSNNNLRYYNTTHEIDHFQCKALLQKSLWEAKRRVAQLKQELGSSSSSSLSSSTMVPNHQTSKENLSYQNSLSERINETSSSSSLSLLSSSAILIKENSTSSNQNLVHNRNVLSIIDRFYNKHGPKHSQNAIEV
ncbi:Protein WWC2 [Sarcoptes scabiei]|uniref:Protein WWC2 n=1 Tax=Sarcoptes scabiei TaxID=52283 RepID=A0A834VFL6_SARSC|nr:Protein WWC2 [Sarcoptes scabiei]